jgi:hypothetical protein
MQGVCCYCQTVHPVQPNTSPSLIEFDSDALDHDECDDWVMQTHHAFGPLCEGGGTTPQALVPPLRPNSKEKLT